MTLPHDFSWNEAIDRLRASMDIRRVVFTSWGTHPENLEQCRQQLLAEGFAPVCKHRQLPVSLYRNKDRDILLQPREDADPQQLFINRAMGVEVGNIDQAAAYALQAGLELFDEGPIGSLQLHIPAVRLEKRYFLYLIDQRNSFSPYMLDFTAEG